jgi:ketosteroid isomerase-like protein
MDPETEIARERLFERISAAFARRDLEAVAEGMRPDVELTLGGSSWLAGTYVGVDEFFRYLAGAALVLTSTDGQLSYIHAATEMTVVHEFMVGDGGPFAIKMPLHEVFTFTPDGMIGSILIRPWDQTKFDRAVNTVDRPSPFD